MRPCGDSRTLEQRRMEAIKLLKEGLGPGEIAKRLGVNRRSAHRWLAAYRDRGIDGIAPLPVLGRPCKLSPHDRERLARMLLDGATSFGYSLDLWSSRRVADLIRQRFGVAYHVNHMSRLLHSLGFIPQKPKRRGWEQDKVAIRGWVRDEWAGTGKTPRD
jgi:putative transposase